VRPFVLVTFFLALSTGLMACTSAPVQEMSDARQAIDAARAAGAEDASEAELARAQALLKAAEEALHGRLYGTAKRYAIDAKAEATEARRKALEETVPSS
jgi:hypothetical protein